VSNKESNESRACSEGNHGRKKGRGEKNTHPRGNTKKASDSGMAEGKEKRQKKGEKRGEKLLGRVLEGEKIA